MIAASHVVMEDMEIVFTDLSKLGASGHLTDCPDAGCSGFEAFVHIHVAAVGDLDTCNVQPQIFRVWNPTHSDGLANVDLEKEVEHSVRIAKIVMSHLTGRYPELFTLKEVPWYAPGDEEVPK
jgi:hypothetical protein